MNHRPLQLALALLGLTGCGVPIGGFVKPPTSAAGGGAGTSLTSIGVNAFLPRLDSARQVTTGELDAQPALVDTASHRGVAGTALPGESFRLELAAGTAAQIVVAGPARSDLVLAFSLSGVEQRVDGDPLSPDLSVESFVVSTELPTSITIRVTDFRGEPVAGLVRWFAFLLASSRGEVSSPGRESGPAGAGVLPARFEFAAEPRGRRLEVIAIGSVGTDLALTATVGDRQLRIDDNPQPPSPNVEGFVLEVDDPAAVAVEVDSTSGAGDVRWAVVPLPPDDRVTPR